MVDFFKCKIISVIKAYQYRDEMIISDFLYLYRDR